MNLTAPRTGLQLYLHETIDVVGQGAWPYMRHVKGAVGSEKAHFDLLGTWSVMGITGRWPQVVNLWEVPGGWDGWTESVRALNLARPDNADLERWWEAAYRHRTGGFDRLLVAAPGSVSCEHLRDSRRGGTLFLHEIARVRPGASSAYLALVAESRVALMAEHGFDVVGLYEVQLTNAEVVTLWSTSVDAHSKWLEALARHDDERIEAWRAGAAEFVIFSHEELMTPLPGTVLGPPEGPEVGGA